MKGGIEQPEKNVYLAFFRNLKENKLNLGLSHFNVNSEQ